MEVVDHRAATAGAGRTEGDAEVTAPALTAVRGDYLEAEGRAAGERVSQLCRWLFIALIAAFNNLGLVPVPDRTIVNVLLGAWVLASAEVSVSLLLGHRPGRVFALSVTAVDVILASAIVYFSGGFDSPFFLALFLTVITSSVRGGVWAGLVSSAVIGLLYLTVGSVAPHVATPPDQERLAVLGRVFMIVVVGVATALTTRELLRGRATAITAAAEAESLRELAVKLASGLGRDEIFRALLERAMNSTGAAEAALYLGTGAEIKRVGEESEWAGSLDPELLKQVDSLQSLADGTVLLVPVELEGAGRAFLRLRGASPFTPRARFQAAALSTTVAGAIAGSLKLQRQAAELETLRGRARDLAAQDRRRTDVFSLVSHELRRPLAVLNVYSELLRRDLQEDQPEGTVRVMDTMASSLREMDLLIDQLQMMTRLDAGEPMPHPAEIDLQEAVEAAMEAVAPLATTEHVLEVVCEQPVTIRSDPQHLQLMLTNLLGNAIKYSPDGGRVTCEISRHGHNGVVEVVDEGIGLAGVDTTHLFKRFSRLPNAAATGAGGIGLGLYICKRLARLQGGNVFAEPRDKQGSTFRLLMPLARR